VVLSFDHDGPSLRNYGFFSTIDVLAARSRTTLLVPFGERHRRIILGLALALTLTARRNRSALIETRAILPYCDPRNRDPDPRALHLYAARIC